MIEAFRNCPVCGNRKVKSLHTLRFELPIGHPLSLGYDLVNCLSCGFVYADTRCSQADYDRFYADCSKYEDQRTSTGGGDNSFDNKRLIDTANTIADFFRDTSIRILDIGCANGGLLKALQKLGYKNLCGLDPSAVCVETTKSLGINAYSGSVFEPFHHDKFDCIVLSHTLEHIQDLRGAIDWIIQTLNPDGEQIVYIEVPDARRYEDFLFAPFQEFNTEHINHFSSLSLNNLMGLTGFEAIANNEKIITISPHMYFPAIYGFWKKNNTKSAFEITPDTQLEVHIAEYIRRSQDVLNGIETRLKKVLRQNPKLIVWGTGQLALKLLVETSLGQANIAAFVDNNPINQGKTLHGLKIISPCDLNKFDYPILITTILHQSEIASQIQQMDLPNSVIYLLD